MNEQNREQRLRSLLDESLDLIDRDMEKSRCFAHSVKVFGGEQVGFLGMSHGKFVNKYGKLELLGSCIGILDLHKHALEGF